MVKQRNKDYARDYIFTYAFSWVFAAFLFFRLSGGDWGFWLFCSICSLLFSFFFLWAPISNILTSNALKVIRIISMGMLFISLALFVAEYVRLLGGESLEIIANKSWRLPIAIVGLLWVCSSVVSVAIQVIYPIAKAQAEVGGGSKREVWLKSLALIAVAFGFLTIILMPLVNIKYVIIILAIGMVLLSSGVFVGIKK